MLAYLLLIPIAVQAQTNAASWQNLNTLQSGEKIQVKSSNGNKITGAFMSVSDTEITLQTDAGPRAILQHDVRRVQRMGSGHRLRNSLIGAGVGAGVGAGIAAGIWENGGYLGGKGDGSAVGAVIGGLAGGIVGALVPGHDTVYHLSSHANVQ